MLTRSLESGGAEVQLASLATGLPRDRFEVTVLCFYEIGSLLDPLRDAGIRVIALKKRGRWDILRFFINLLRQLRRLQPDVIHAFLGPPNVLAALAKPFLPGTRIIWGIRASAMDLEHYDATRRLTLMAERWLSRYADFIVANSVAGRDHVRGHGFPDRLLTVVSNGIDTARFGRDETARVAVRNDWGVAPADCLIGLVGRLDPKKDHETFLRAAALLLKTNGAVRFVCIGSDGLSDQEKLHALAIKLGVADHLIWAGHRTDLPLVLNALDIHCSASAFGEGFSNAVAESMAAGIPNVVTDVGDSARIVGDLGKIAPPGDPAALARACGELIALGESGRRALGDRCAARIEAEFSRPKLIKQMAKIYRDQVESKPS
ncbi:MAG: glycosyltransferase [Proteobacteria bacterium]|nr:glycosyltransferase [Pseudomonadota bacterium]